MALYRHWLDGGDFGMFDAVQALIGTVPSGFEPVVYVLCIPVLLWLLSQFFGLLWAIIGGIARAG